MYSKKNLCWENVLCWKKKSLKYQKKLSEIEFIYVLKLLKPTHHVMHQQFNHLKPTGYVMHQQF